MSTSKDILKVKDSFESQSFKAPEGLWNGISNELDNIAVDDTVKGSFESATYKAPAFDFGALSNDVAYDQLVKDSFEQTVVSAPQSVWEGIQSGLYVDDVWDRMNDDIKVRSNQWQVVAVAASIALLFSVIPFSTFDTEVYDFSTNASLINISNDEIVISFDEGDDVENNLALNEPSNENNTFMVQNLGTDQDVENELVEDDLNLLADNQIGLLDQNHKLDGELHPAVEIFKEEVVDKWSFSVGVIGGLNNTWLFDNDTRASFEKESLLDSKFSIGEMYGLTADVRLNNEHSLTANVLLNDVKRGKLGYYENGLYKQRNTQINFFKTSLLYGYQFNFSGLKRDHNLILRAGPYLGVTKSSAIVNEGVLTSFNSSYKKIDMGVNLQIGQEYNFNKLILGYGLNSEIGLKNIFSGNSNLPSKLNYTNNFSAGVYLSLKYSL